MHSTLEPDSTILVDLDGVVAEQLPQLCRYLEREYNLNLEPNQIDDWSFQIPGEDHHVGEAIVHLMEHEPEWYFGGMEPRDGVADALRAISSAYQVEIATHRIPETHDISKAWLADYDIPYDRFHETVPRDKGAVPGDVLIDDYHMNVANAIAAGKTGILMEQPYSDPSACADAYVATSWNDVVSLLDI